MYGDVPRRELYRPSSTEIRDGRPVQARARDRARRRARTSTRGRRRACSTSAPTTTSASPTIPRSSPPPTRRSTAGATAWRRCASSAARRSSTSELEQRLSRLPRHRGHDPLRLLLRRQRRPLRDAARRRGRGHLRRAQPRLDHRRHPALQGAAAPLRATATWTSSRRGWRGRAGARRRLIATDGVFSMDGYLARLDRDLRPRRAPRRAGDGRRLARGRLRRAATGAARPSCYGVADRVDIVTGTLGKALGGASGGYVSGRARDRRAAAPALAALPLLQHASPRRSSPPALRRRSTCSRLATSCATGCATTPRASARG